MKPVYGNHRQIWISHHGEIPVDDQGRSYHIHHLDGNPLNNDISNLICLSPEDHYEVHLKQGDYGAAFLLMRNHLSLSKEERSFIVSKANSNRWNNYSESKRQEILSKNQQTNINTWSSPELRAKTGSKISTAHKNRTSAQKAEEGKRRSSAAIVGWKTGTHEAHKIHMATKVQCPWCGKNRTKSRNEQISF